MECTGYVSLIERVVLCWILKGGIAGVSLLLDFNSPIICDEVSIIGHPTFLIFSLFLIVGFVVSHFFLR